MKTLINQKLEAEFEIFNTKQSCCIIMHGFDSSMHSRSVTSLAEKFAKNKQNYLRFSFKGHGNSQGSLSETCVSNQVSDLKSIIEFLEAQGIEKFKLVGSSFSGQVALCLANQLPEKIQKIALKCPLISGAELFASQLGPIGLKQWASCNKHEYPRHNGEVLNLPYSFYQDLLQNDPLKFLDTMQIPTTIVHGDADTTVPITQVIRAKQLQPKIELDIIPNADHRFSDPKHFQLMQEYLYDFLSED